ncbi:pyridoxamine 5'-phosphate oxidase family protein [Marinomonas mediterranea]|uniref:pyridoxamine 5'-phosphate oxidase family protein n=1 Tax=Marinomonas mediterranea TaxID=119864 RepID=UPI00234A171C|nr:pyridoxamine 5'-phosphate oxidase family protein [Marinomonas mediterranea]WCN09189.1 pyridoxamine 5'-phosphate oxidase family protein [Marinomonas mediterranea]
MKIIKSIGELESLYPPTKERAKLKQMSALDKHMRNFISKSPFAVISTKGADGLGDVSPRGGDPGFALVVDELTIALPDWPGNNRLDNLENIIDHPGIGLMFMIPGVNETLRVNGLASIVVDAPFLAQFEMRGKLPRSVILIDIKEAYLHCAKAIVRSGLWLDENKIERSELPTLGQMIKDQVGMAEEPESQEEMERRQAKSLY